MRAHWRGRNRLEMRAILLLLEKPECDSRESFTRFSYRDITKHSIERERFQIRSVCFSQIYIYSLGVNSLSAILNALSNANQPNAFDPGIVPEPLRRSFTIYHGISRPTDEEDHQGGSLKQSVNSAAQSLKWRRNPEEEKSEPVWLWKFNFKWENYL